MQKINILELFSQIKKNHPTIPAVLLLMDAIHAHIPIYLSDCFIIADRSGLQTTAIIKNVPLVHEKR